MNIKKQMIAAIKKRVDAAPNKTIEKRKEGIHSILGYNKQNQLVEGRDYCGWETLNNMDEKDLFEICILIGVTIKID